MATRSAVVSAIAKRQREYYKNQTELCDGDQSGLFRVMSSLMERRSDPILPLSISDVGLASSFSKFFSEKIMRIRLEFHLNVSPDAYSVEFTA